jgi:hypothetical protein
MVRTTVAVRMVDRTHNAVRQPGGQAPATIRNTAIACGVAAIDSLP